MSGGGGKSGDTVVGYRYYMGVHLAISHGPVDSVNRIIVGERPAWTGNVTSSQQIYVNAPELFGGERREGGVQGAVDIMMGEATQQANQYLASAIGTGASSNTTVVYTMSSVPDGFGNVRWRVWKRTISGSSDTTQLLFDSTAPGDPNAEANANNAFVRTSSTTSTNDGLTGTTTWTTTIQAGNIPAFRGLLTMVFRRFMWTAMNPYFKPVWVGVTRILKGWQNDAPWYPEKAVINTTGTPDMNPVHIIYQCMTDPTWGMGEPRNAFDDAVWRAAADKLAAEGFGLSLRWTSQTTIKAFVGEICNHINGNVRLNMMTGLFELVLMRDDYDINALTELNIDNVREISSFQRAQWGELASELVVTFTTRDDKPTSIAIQNPAAVDAQGGVVTTTRDYPGIRDPNLAQRVALRDLRTLSSPLAKVTLKCNRVAWALAEGDVFRFKWEPLGIVALAMRIVRIDKGNLQNGEITIEAVEDVFGMPSAVYTATQPPVWVDPSQPPHAVQKLKLREAPYWDVVRRASAADFNALPSDFAFGEAFARYGTGTSFSYDLYAAGNDSTPNYSLVTTGHYSPNALTATPVGQTDTVIRYVGADRIDATVVGGYAYIGDECVAVDAFDAVGGTLTVRRGVLDTVPVAHAPSEEIWCATITGSDMTTRASGETVYYRLSPATGQGRFSIGNTGGTALALTGRAQKPYPPGRFQVNSAWWPAHVAGSISANWAHRDRTQQTVSLNDYTTGNIGPEPGTSYTLRVLRADGTVLRTYSNIAGTSWTYSAADQAADGFMPFVRIQLATYRGATRSMQQHDLTVERYGLGFHLGRSLGDPLQ